MLALMPNAPEPIVDLWRGVAERGAWSEAEHKQLADEMGGGDWKRRSPVTVRKAAEDFLDLWIDPVQAPGQFHPVGI